MYQTDHSSIRTNLIIISKYCFTINLFKLHVTIKYNSTVFIKYQTRTHKENTSASRGLKLCLWGAFKKKKKERLPVFLANNGNIACFFLANTLETLPESSAISIYTYCILEQSRQS